jgi:hypothetical protein
VFVILDILRRIRIFGSVHCITDLDLDPDLVLIVSGFLDVSKKQVFVTNFFFAYYLL